MTNDRGYIGWECGTSRLELDARRGDCLKCLAETFDGVSHPHAFHDQGDVNLRDARLWERGGPYSAPGHVD